MQNQTATPNRDALIAYIANLTPAQCDKLVDRLPLIQQMVKASPDGLRFAEYVLDKVSA